MSATNAGNNERTAATDAGEAAVGAPEGGEDGAKPPLQDSFNHLRLDNIRPPHVRQDSSTSIPLPARDDRSLHHRPTSGIGAEVHGSSDTDGSTAPNSPKAADAETKAAIRAAKDDVPIGELGEAHHGGAQPPTSGHAITAAKLFAHRFFANEAATPSAGSVNSTAGGASAIATPGGTVPPSPAEMSRQSSAAFPTPPLQQQHFAGSGQASPAHLGHGTPSSPGVAGDSPSHHAAQQHPAHKAPSTASSSPRRPTITKADSITVAKGHAHANEARPALTDRKSVFGKFFDKKDKDGRMADSGAESDGGYTSGGGGAGRLGRKPSGKKANGAVPPVPALPPHANGDHSGGDEGAPMTRQTSTGSKHGGRTPSEKGEEKTSNKLRDMVAMAPKLGRKASSSRGGRSDDGKSDDGAETRSRAGSQATASLLKKYGVCEKTAIGKGATAVVRLAHKWDRGTDKLYAVKEFRKRRKGETEKEYVKKLTSEFCISSTLHHENVVETVDLVQDENHHWCEVMEYCPGGDLYAAIKRGSMSQAEINSYFKQVLLGVKYLHSMGVAHRDIKPENLLLDGKGKIKITDFGVSDVFRMCWEKTTHMSKGLCGSEPYLPKEMFERKEYDARLVDVWASAVVYYCCCMQELPWRVAKPTDPSFAVYLQSYSSVSPTPLTNLHRESRALIKKMLSPEPEGRPQLEDILADKWVKSLEVIEVAVPLMTLKDRV